MILSMTHPGIFHAREQKIKNITKEIIENFERYFDWYSSTSKTFKHPDIIEMLNMWSQVPVHPFGFAIVPVDAVSLVF